MKKSTTAALALVAILAVGGGIAVAQQGPAGGPGPGMEHGSRGHGGMRGWMRGSPETMQRMLDGRIAGTKTALRLSPEQEKLWPAVEQTVREMAAKHFAKREEMRGRMKEAREKGEGRQRPDMLEMLERGSQRSAERSADMKKMAEALRPLYVTLSDEQKQVLAASIRKGRGGWGGGWGRHRG